MKNNRAQMPACLLSTYDPKKGGKKIPAHISGLLNIF